MCRRILLFVSWLIVNHAHVQKLDSMNKLNSCYDENEVYMPEGGAPAGGDIHCNVVAADQEAVTIPFIMTEGCYCRAGYARNKANICIPYEQCPTPLCHGPNEIYLGESDNAPSDPECLRLDCIHTSRSHNDSRSNSDCYCISGAARDPNGTCIPAVNCPTVGRNCAGTNEVFLRSAGERRSDSFCDFNSIKAFLDKNNMKLGSYCYCRKGYVRNENMQCVERKYCDVICPGDNEIFLPRGTAPRCELRCYRSEPIKCLPLYDMPEGCFCREGYCKNDRNECVRVQEGRQGCKRNGARCNEDDQDDERQTEKDSQLQEDEDTEEEIKVFKIPIA